MKETQQAGLGSFPFVPRDRGVALLAFDVLYKIWRSFADQQLPRRFFRRISRSIFSWEEWGSFDHCLVELCFVFVKMGALMGFILFTVSSKVLAKSGFLHTLTAKGSIEMKIHHVFMRYFAN